MYLVAIGWVYVVLMMAIAEASSSQGSLLGAVLTFLLYGVLPLSIVLYLMRTPARRQARRAADQALLNPDGSSHAARDPVAPEGEKP
jgi:uncharacterized membrane protein